MNSIPLAALSSRNKTRHTTSLTRKRVPMRKLREKQAFD
jgi:hypothetical protein